jgi:secreted trypsin-like serine protease
MAGSRLVATHRLVTFPIALDLQPFLVEAAAPVTIAHFIGVIVLESFHHQLVPGERKD